MNATEIQNRIALLQAMIDRQRPILDEEERAYEPLRLENREKWLIQMDSVHCGKARLAEAEKEIAALRQGLDTAST